MVDTGATHGGRLRDGLEEPREAGSHRSIEPAILYFGTPVVLLSTLNEDGSANLAPMSSAWALGWSVMLGLGAAGKTAENLTARRECVINLPTDAMWRAVERLAPLTGKYPIPESKRERFRFERDKFAAAGLTPLASECVRPPRVAECPLQLEAITRDVRLFGGPNGGAICVEAQVMRVHAHPEILADSHHIAPAAWRPLIYNFRHYFGLGQELGKTFRAET